MVEHLSLIRIHHILMPLLRSPLRRLKVKRRYNTSDCFMTLRQLPTASLQWFVFGHSDPLSFQTALPIVLEVFIVWLRPLGVNGFRVVFLLYVNLMLKGLLVVLSPVLASLRNGLEGFTIIVLYYIFSFVLSLILLNLILYRRRDMLVFLLRWLPNGINNLCLSLSWGLVNSSIHVVIEVLILRSGHVFDLWLRIISLKWLYVAKRVLDLTFFILLLPHFCKFLERWLRSFLRWRGWGNRCIPDPLLSSLLVALRCWDANRDTTISMLVDCASIWISHCIITVVQSFIGKVLVVATVIITSSSLISLAIVLCFS